jgi:electron transport complex protein RnfE
MASAADALGMGIGFTLALSALAAVRELFGTGSLVGSIPFLFSYHLTNVFGPHFKPFSFMIQAPGAFICLGLMLCLMNLAATK